MAAHGRLLEHINCTFNWWARQDSFLQHQRFYTKSLWLVLTCTYSSAPLFSALVYHYFDAFYPLAQGLWINPRQVTGRVSGCLVYWCADDAWVPSMERDTNSIQIGGSIKVCFSCHNNLGIRDFVRHHTPIILLLFVCGAHRKIMTNDVTQWPLTDCHLATLAPWHSNPDVAPAINLAPCFPIKPAVCLISGRASDLCQIRCARTAAARWEGSLCYRMIHSHTSMDGWDARVVKVLSKGLPMAMQQRLTLVGSVRLLS